MRNVPARLGALFGCNSGEGGPALLDILASTARADNLAQIEERYSFPKLQRQSSMHAFAIGHHDQTLFRPLRHLCGARAVEEIELRPASINSGPSRGRVTGLISLDRV